MTLLLLLALACPGGRADAPAGESPAAEPPSSEARTEEPAGLPTMIPAPGTVGRPPAPASLDAGCLERVEGRQSQGECATDADCARAGCSAEVCVPSAVAADVITTCEVLPCFAALDACGCHDGTCAWTLKTGAGAP